MMNIAVPTLPKTANSVNEVEVYLKTECQLPAATRTASVTDNFKATPAITLRLPEAIIRVRPPARWGINE